MPLQAWQTTKQIKEHSDGGENGAAPSLIMIFSEASNKWVIKVLWYSSVRAVDLERGRASKRNIFRHILAISCMPRAVIINGVSMSGNEAARLK